MAPEDNGKRAIGSDHCVLLGEPDPAHLLVERRHEAQKQLSYSARLERLACRLGVTPPLICPRNGLAG